MNRPLSNPSPQITNSDAQNSTCYPADITNGYFALGGRSTAKPRQATIPPETNRTSDGPPTLESPLPKSPTAMTHKARRAAPHPPPTTGSPSGDSPTTKSRQTKIPSTENRVVGSTLDGLPTIKSPLSKPPIKTTRSNRHTTSPTVDPASGGSPTIKPRRATIPSKKDEVAVSTPDGSPTLESPLLKSPTITRKARHTHAPPETSSPLDASPTQSKRRVTPQKSIWRILGTFGIQGAGRPQETQRSLRPERTIDSSYPSVSLIVSMGRWTYKDEDSSRLPDGFTRVAYDADLRIYTYHDEEGRLYQGAPGASYGLLTPLPTSGAKRNNLKRSRMARASRQSAGSDAQNSPTEPRSLSQSTSLLPLLESPPQSRPATALPRNIRRILGALRTMRRHPNGQPGN
ncbi:hypothetical protein BD779DRAFT_1803811 [Infundibulicybe gibba]|nr:hypothetical protein BD779DRAFT_1803811 [Infundibulicybe gibba]